MLFGKFLVQISFYFFLFMSKYVALLKYCLNHTLNIRAGDDAPGARLCHA